MISTGHFSFRTEACPRNFNILQKGQVDRWVGGVAGHEIYYTVCFLGRQVGG